MLIFARIDALRNGRRLPMPDPIPPLSLPPPAEPEGHAASAAAPACEAQPGTPEGGGASLHRAPH
ncbi:pescadillo [Chlorella sorokiniana]|uniref:Pescadillo n=1 Tax=Chlorella sorokiniana TaxID=3076 RepID=A0A2P6TCI4_CHLSO|nr:pescadillo [Chlorella sorokiniana]|eukprot:PRW20349.1 pescadillo [Chlorella sorokiniana]